MRDDTRGLRSRDDDAWRQVGIAVPEAEEVMAWAKKEGVAGGSVATILAGPDGPKLTKAVHAQMHAASKAAKLAGFEMVKKLYLEHELW